jgi:hypothetical protein
VVIVREDFELRELTKVSNVGGVHNTLKMGSRNRVGRVGEIGKVVW